ncbi:hypothetical protein F511_23943 [Dorcoceras hygrometricum]|uniref:Uncharacterized protein n=1 Tax=Dorcoceras hygrometricum TaxID=472368 RepID=A0A2Z7BUK7_9LAMI|nr:hypothetical protein F511_23943 [Dorcoceras hygrometricum]
MRSRDQPLTSRSFSLLRSPLAEAPWAGPPPGPAGPNLTSLGPNHGRTREHEPGEGDAPFHTARGVLVFPDGRSASYRRCRREIGAQPALDHQSSPMDEYFRNLCYGEWRGMAGG